MRKKSKSHTMIPVCTRINSEPNEKIAKLIKQTGLKRAEILRRLIYLGLNRVKKPEDLLKIYVKED